jgi:hypothetical protein
MEENTIIEAFVRFRFASVAITTEYIQKIPVRFAWKIIVLLSNLFASLRYRRKHHYRSLHWLFVFIPFSLLLLFKMFISDFSLFIIYSTDFRGKLRSAYEMVNYRQFIVQQFKRESHSSITNMQNNKKLDTFMLYICNRSPPPHPPLMSIRVV